MKLQRHSNRKVGDKKYYKNSIDLSPKMVRELGWQKGSDLNAKISHDRLIIRKKR